MTRSIASLSKLAALAVLLFTTFGFRAPSAQVGGAAPSDTRTEMLPPNVPGLAIFYTGLRHATLEPCGCHTKQQGGLQLEATLYHQYDSVPQLRLDAGSWASMMGNRMPTEPLKTAFLLRGLHMMNFDAVNVSVSDVEMTQLWFDTLRKEHPEALQAVVSCNVFAKATGKLAFAESKIVTRKLADGSSVKVGITGVASLRTVSEVEPVGAHSGPKEVRTESFIIKDPLACLAEELDKLKGQCGMLVVLYSGDLPGTIDLAQKFPQVDVIVASAYNNDPSVNYLREGKTTVMLNATMQGKDVREVNLKRAPEGWLPEGPGGRLIVSKDFANDAKLTALIEEYKAATRSIAAEMPPPDAPQIYAGDNKCINCHIVYHNQWRGTPHARAMATLVERNQQFNPDCVRCHVTGYKTGNGFYHITDQNSQLYMSNVQCEDCHGPAQQHVFDMQTLQSGAEKWMPKPQFEALKKSVAAGMPKRNVPKEVCMQCHTSVTDPDFDYAKKIVKVNHTKPYTPDPGESTGKMHGMPAQAKGPGPMRDKPGHNAKLPSK